MPSMFQVWCKLLRIQLKRICVQKMRGWNKISWVKTVLSLPQVRFCSIIPFLSYNVHIWRKKKESKTMHGELTHHAANINLLFTRLSQEERRKNQDDNKNREKMNMLKLCISTLSWHCAETPSSCFAGHVKKWPWFMVPPPQFRYSWSPTGSSDKGRLTAV